MLKDVLKLLILIAAAYALLAAKASRQVDAQSGYNKPKPQTDKSQVPAESKDGALKLNSTVVNIATLVSDRSGRYIPQLTKDDFELFEDGVRQQVAFFGNEEVPFNVALLMDVSGSVSSSLKDIKKAATEFVRQLRPNDRVMVVCFDEHVMYLTDFTNERRRLDSAINGCQTGHGTSIYEAVYDTVATRFRGIDGRKAMLLLSDGEDTTSRKVGYDETIDRVAESDVLVYGIRYPDFGARGGRGGWGQPGNSPFPGRRRWPFASAGQPENGTSGGQIAASLMTIAWTDPQNQYPQQYPRRGQRGPYGQRRRDQGRDFMKDVTEAGGGPVYDAKSVGEIGKLAQKIADELRHVYVIGYYPTKPLSEGGYRTVTVKVKGRDDLAVRHRKGYDARQTAPAPAS